MKNKLPFLLIFLFGISGINYSFSQDQKKIDSLEIVLKSATNESIKADLLNQISKEYIRIDPDKALKHAEEALALSEKINDITLQASALGNIGRSFMFKNEFPNALKFSLRSLQLNEQVGNKSGIAKACQTLGNVYHATQKHDQAIIYYERSLKLFLELNDKTGTFGLYQNLGLLYFQKHDLQKALDYYLKGSQLINEISNPAGIALLYLNIGNIYREQKNYTSALDYYKTTLTIYEKLHDKLGIARTFTDMANLYSRQNDFKKSIEYYNRTLDLVKNVDAKSWQTTAYEGLSVAYEGLKDPAHALKYYKMYTAIKDSALNSENFEQIADLKAQYEIDKKAKERDLIENRKEVLRQAQISRQKLIRNVLVAASLFVIIFAFWRARIKQKANIKLASAYTTIEEKNKDITDSINYAKGIQASILPTEEEIKKLLPESFVLYKPKDIVSGDIYFIEPINTNDKVKLIGFAAADCTGHGVPGAFMSIFGVNILRQSLTQSTVNSPAEVLDYLNQNLQIALRQHLREQHIRDGMDIAFCVIDPHTNDLYFAGANNPLWIIKNDRSFMEIKGDKQPIGYFPDQKPFMNHAIKLSKGDTIYVFTDGYADQFGGEKGKKFKYKKLQELLISIQSETMEKQREILSNTIDNWKGNLEQVDDILVIGVRV